MVKILFLHPDLGIGGAERLVLDAAIALKNKNYDVSFLTNHHDPKHCFKETIDGTFHVQVVGDWIPRKIFGRFYALCAYFRMMYAAFYASFVLSRRQQIDIFFCDQISVCLPILRLAANRPKTLFYCHFPDQLLSAKEGTLKRIYRAPLNYMEEVTLRCADTILVNSKFTLKVFRDTFRRLDVIPDVLYPSLNTKYYDEMLEIMEEGKHILNSLPDFITKSFVFVDINRYERKKNHGLAIKAFKKFKDLVPENDWKYCKLTIAGGYDTRCTENVEHFDELVALAKDLQIMEHVTFLKSPLDDIKFHLIYSSHCVLYTPANEHFGIVPLEAMYLSKPVIAVNNGGPTETIANNINGLLCDGNDDDFSYAMWKLYKDKSLRERMGAMGKLRVIQKFSFGAFTSRLDLFVTNLLKPKEELNEKEKIN